MTPPRPLRTHQQRLAHLVAAMAAGETTACDILAAVTPGGGKSLLPVIAAARLIEAGLIERICWIVPRDSLRLQAEEAFTDPAWRSVLGHGLLVRAADNTADPSRGLAGYITTYQGVAAAPDLHLREMRRYRTLLVVDEVHHLPALADTDPDAAARASATDEEQASAWSQAILPLLECAAVRLLLSGTLERADGKAILWLAYRKGVKARTREIELDAPGWAIIGYSRAQALLKRAVLPVTFGALDGEARWRDEDDNEIGPHRLANLHPDETTRPALFTALRTGFAETLLREAFIAIRDVRARRRQEHDLGPGVAAPGLGKLLVLAPDQATAKHYLGVIRRWIPAAQAEETAQLATSDTPRAHQILASFRLRPEPSILVTVAMAYEGLDAPDVAVVAALTHIRSRAWLEQIVARATRVDPNAGAYETQRALVFHPDDPLFALFRRRMEYEQGTLARPKAKRKQSALPLWLLDQLPPAREGIIPLESDALALRFDTLRPGPELAPALKRPELEAAQAVEDEAGCAGLKGGTAGPGLYRRYNAVLKRMTGNKNRARLHLLDDDPRYAWTARQRSEWKPPIERSVRTTT